MPPLSAVFLDVGNTLLYEEPSRFALYAEAARRRGRDVDAKEMTALMRRAHHELPQEIDGAFRYSDPWFAVYIRRIFVEYLELPEGEEEPIRSELFETFEDPSTFRLFPGAGELLEELAASPLRVGVISNWSARLPRVLEALDLTQRFDFVLCSAIERLEKPDPAIFQAALERAGVEPAAALHVGDHPEKDGAAAELGIGFCLVDHTREGLEPVRAEIERRMA